MPYSPEHRARVRERTVSNARHLFNRRGFNADSIDDVIAEAGLKRAASAPVFSAGAMLSLVLRVRRLSTEGAG